MYYVLHCLELIVSRLPVSLALKAGVIIGSLGYILDIRHRRLALSNIRRAFGRDKGIMDAADIARRSFQNIGKNMIEFLRNRPEDIKLDGFEKIKGLVKNNTPVIFILGHFGNWEVMGRKACDRGLILTVVEKAIKNKGLNRYVRERRISSGMEVLEKKGSANQLLGLLRMHKNIALLIDQYAGRKGVFVGFFGIPTSTTPSPAVLALRTGAVICPVFIIREPNDKHRIIFESPVDIIKTGDIKMDIYNTTQEFVSILEKYVKQYPEQWWWVHRRWRKDDEGRR